MRISQQTCKRLKKKKKSHNVLCNNLVWKIVGIVVFAACSVYKKFHTFFVKGEPVCGKHTATDAAHNLSGMCLQHTNLLSAESKVVSSECDNREQRCVPVSGDWWIKEVCLYLGWETSPGMLISSKNRTPNTLMKIRINKVRFRSVKGSLVNYLLQQSH